jgi:hypothetical protein
MRSGRDVADETHSGVKRDEEVDWKQLDLHPSGRSDLETPHPSSTHPQVFRPDDLKARLQVPQGERRGASGVQTRIGSRPLGPGAAAGASPPRRDGRAARAGRDLLAGAAAPAGSIAAGAGHRRSRRGAPAAGAVRGAAAAAPGGRRAAQLLPAGRRRTVQLLGRGRRLVVDAGGGLERFRAGAVLLGRRRGLLALVVGIRLVGISNERRREACEGDQPATKQSTATTKPAPRRASKTAHLLRRPRHRHRVAVGAAAVVAAAAAAAAAGARDAAAAASGLAAQLSVDADLERRFEGLLGCVCGLIGCAESGDGAATPAQPIPTDPNRLPRTVAASTSSHRFAKSSSSTRSTSIGGDEEADPPDPPGAAKDPPVDSDSPPLPGSSYIRRHD